MARSTSCPSPCRWIPRGLLIAREHRIEERLRRFRHFFERRPGKLILTCHRRVGRAPRFQRRRHGWRQCMRIAESERLLERGPKSFCVEGPSTFSGASTIRRSMSLVVRARLRRTSRTRPPFSVAVSPNTATMRARNRSKTRSWRLRASPADDAQEGNSGFPFVHRSAFGGTQKGIQGSLLCKCAPVAAIKPPCSRCREGV